MPLLHRFIFTHSATLNERPFAIPSGAIQLFITFERTRAVCSRSAAATHIRCIFVCRFCCARPGAKNPPLTGIRYEQDVLQTDVNLKIYRSLSPKRARQLYQFRPAFAARAITFAQLYRHYFCILYTGSRNVCTSVVAKRGREDITRTLSCAPPEVNFPRRVYRLSGYFRTGRSLGGLAREKSSW